MNPLRACLLALAVFTATTGTATAQSSTATSPYSLGQALPLGGSWTVRSDYSPGLKWTGAETLRLNNGRLPANRASLYADWFPFESNSFRVVGGLSLNHPPTGYTLNSGAWPGQGINPLRRTPGSSTYLGIGYGQHGLGSRGLDFYADMGVSLGGLSQGDSEVNGIPATALEGWRTQSNGWLGFRYLPSVSLGLIYRY